MLRKARRLKVYLHRGGADGRCTTESERPESSLITDSVVIAPVAAIEDEMVERVFRVLPPTESLPAFSLFNGDDDVDVPATLRTVRRDFVYQAIIVFGRGQEGLILLLYKRMSAVPSRDCGDAVSARSVLGRGTGQEIAACAILAARIVCEKVLEQSWRCLACSDSRG